MPDSLALEAVKPALRGRFGAVDYRYAERCDSTQDLIEADAPEGAVAVTDEQTAGRGRRGRSWDAPAGAALLCSVCLRPAASVAELPTLTVVAAEAIVEAIAEFELSPSIKAPNDVLVRGHKLAGVIAEARGAQVIVGVGLNVNQTVEELPERPVFPATSLRVELGRTLPRAPLLAEFLRSLESRYATWLGERGAR